LQYSLTLACHPERNDVSRSETECSRGTLRLHSKAGGSCSLTSACHPERNDVSRSETECSRGTLLLIPNRAAVQSNLPPVIPSATTARAAGRSAVEGPCV